MALKPIQWVFYISEMGRPVVRIEIEKMRLSADEMKKLETTLARISTGMSTWHDSDYLGSEIWEVRVRLQHKQIRVLYSVENTRHESRPVGCNQESAENTASLDHHGSQKKKGLVASRE